MHLLLAGLAAAESGRILIEGHALGSDSIVHSSIDGRSTEAARLAPPGFETAGGTSQPACGASRNILGVPTDVQRKIDNRGSLGGPRKTCSAFDGCRGGGDYAEKMVSVELAGAGAAGSSAHHAPNASASLGEDACAEAAKRENCVMNECACATRESWDASGTCGADGGETLGQSRPTFEIAQGEKLLQAGARGFVRAIVDKISTLVTVTQQGPLRSERMACADLSQMNAAEGAVLTAAVLPLAHERGAAAAMTASGPIAGDTDHGRFDLSQWLSGGRAGGCGGGYGASGGGSGGSGGGGASSRQATEAALSTARRTQRSLQSAGTHGAIIGRKGRTVQAFAHPSSASELIGAETAPATAAVGANLAVGGTEDKGEEHGLAAQLHAGKGRVGIDGGSGSSPPGLLLGSTSSPGADSDVVTDPSSGVTATVRASATAHSAGTRAATARAASAVQGSNASRLASPKALPSGLVSSCRMRLSEPILPCRADVGEALGTSWAAGQQLLRPTQGEKLHQTGARGFVRAIVDKISTLVTVTQQGRLRSERMACADLSQMNAAEGAVLTAAVLPLAHERGAAAAMTASGPIAGDTDHGRDLSQWLSRGRAGGGCGGGYGGSGGGSGGSGGGGASSRQATEAAVSTARRTQRSLQSAGTHGAIIGRKGRTVQAFAHPSSASDLIGAETAPSTAAVEATLAVGGAEDNGEEHGLAAQLHAGKGRVGTGGGSGSSPPGLLLGSTSSPGADSDVVADPLSGVTATVRASATAHPTGSRAATLRAASAVQDSNMSRLASPKALPSGLVSSCWMRLSEPTLACRADVGEALGTSWATGQQLLRPTQGEKLLQAGARGFVRAIVDKISTLVTVTQQGRLRSERMACADLSQEKAAEGAVLTAAVLPFAHERGATAAATTSGPIAGDTDHGRFDLSQWLSGGRGGGRGGGYGGSGGGSGGSGGGGASSRQATEAALSTARRTQRSLQSAGTHGAIIGRKGRTVQAFAHPSSASELIGAETAPSTAAVEANLAAGGAKDDGEEHGLAAQMHAGKGRVGTGGGSGSSPPGLLLGSTSSPGADSDVVTDHSSGVTATVHASATAHSAGTRAATARAVSAVQGSNASRLASPKAFPSGLVSSCQTRLSEPTLACRADVGEALGTSWATGQQLLRPTQGEKLLQAGARGFVRAIVDKISTLVTVTQQGRLRSERMACADLSQMNAAEGAVLTAAVLPLAHERGAAAAMTASGPIAGDTDHGRFDLSQWLSGGRAGGCGGGYGASGGGSGGSGGGGASSRQATEAALSTARRTQRSLQSAGTHGAIIGRKGRTVQAFAHPSSASELIGAETAPATAAVGANLAVGGTEDKGEEHGLAAQLHAGKGRVGIDGGSGSSPPGLLLGSTSSPGADSDVVTDPSSGVTATVRASATAHSAGTRGGDGPCQTRLSEPILPCRTDVGEALGTSWATGQQLLRPTQGEKLLQAGARAIVDKISTLVTVTQQGRLRSERMACADLSQMNAAEGAVLTAAVLPFAHECGAAAAMTASGPIAGDTDHGRFDLSQWLSRGRAGGGCGGGYGGSGGGSGGSGGGGASSRQATEAALSTARRTQRSLQSAGTHGAIIGRKGRTATLAVGGAEGKGKEHGLAAQLHASKGRVGTGGSGSSPRGLGMASTSSPGADVDVVIDPVIDPENAPSTTVLEAKLAIGMLGLYCARPDPDSIS
ncbi:hypothetical protein EMIHUDRAFT_122743, partial [Emiliania huxleyi CCMP1516]|uniref:K Homology domain-containing protein n=2 Tax=Emiliania huxleyi TaxID=2903 RepID=A0A0D3KG02_EMIH1